MDRHYAWATGAVIVALVLARVFRRGFDPFAPIWLFLAGYFQVYVIQALTSRDYALRVRGPDILTDCNARALWALLWFLAVYFSGIGKVIARRLPRAPRSWSPGLVLTIVPPLVLWGLACASVLLSVGQRIDERTVLITPRQRLLLQFPTVQLVAAVLLIVTGRQPGRPRPIMTLAGIATAMAYTAVWMFYGRRSHALFGVLTLLAAFYLPRMKRPSLPTLAGAAFAGCLVVALALSWRFYCNRHPLEQKGPMTFVRFASEFDPAEILVSLNVIDDPSTAHRATREATSRETIEFGGYLLMMDTVPRDAGYDFGAPYIRLISTYVPRLIWRDKPIYGRDQWVAAWMAGSEFRREADFTGPAIGLLGAAHLNGGAVATVVVMAAVATVIRVGYDYFRFYADTPWAQSWWSLTYFNAWLMTVNDNPAVWFYYLYGHMIFPFLILLWIGNRALGRPGAAIAPAPSG